MDAVAVSISNGMCMRRVKIKHAFAMAFSYGLFQGIMPLLGYYAGSIFAERISALDHWIALILLGFIGGKMIYETLGSKDEIPCLKLNFRLLLMQSIATSIDALAIGVGFAALTVNIFDAVIIIMITTFILSFIAVFIGKKSGAIIRSKAGIIGGAILIFTGLKIFIEHIFFQ